MISLDSKKVVLTLKVNDERLVFITISDLHVEIANGVRTYQTTKTQWDYIPMLTLTQRLESIGLKDLSVSEVNFIKRVVSINL
ncbi:hypothetical protein DPMPNEAM_00099 [Escherichia phage p000y]|uniref:DUF7290 domain-containing protein n=3 Tax=Mosigvirus TaxID=1913652 RepID=A0A3G2KBY9_9CAUD|nr:hypothetical protein PI26_gp075 [Shigella phage Shf125875]AYN56528.1 hypothetical protein DPMPNEAM_00099 [Escherichia phage p000y]EEZ6272190.1 hypothetical protein [Escherichia coli]QSL99170.1 hypothetical protein FEPPCPPO_00073 [Escherichia phage PTK]CAH1487083.1 hypothetical protein UGJNECP1_00256 [Escherichia phage UGJNEcP1]CAH1616414.1 hypothetical protein UGJNECP2_00164 [Escherichia phage UGJNEcP2]